jgi:transcriptional regulator with XRE-family HTH domain
VRVTGSPEQDRPVDGPTAVRIILGAHLRQLREERGLTRAEAGETIRASESKLSRMELGRVGFKMRDVKDLLTLYGVHDEAEREAVLARVRQANEPSWWQPYSDVTPDWFQRYLGLEAAASLIRTYEVAFVPGLLQTEEYARAVMRLSHGTRPPEQVERRVELRLQRQQALTRPDPPQLWAVVDEAALRRPVGGRRVMRDQLESLVAMLVKAPNVSLQVVPLAAGGYAAAGSPFTILRFPQASLPDLVYIEQLAGALYLDKREDVDKYFDAVTRLVVAAAPVRDTVRILDRIIHDLDHDVIE